MTKAWKFLVYIAVAILLSFAPAAFAGTASMTLTGAGSNVLAGVYVGPYTATINGTSTPVICDDFGDESYLPESWTANISTFPGLTSVKYTGASETKQYDEVAYLAFELLAAPGNSLKAGEIQYALWDVFDPSAISYLNGSNAAAATAAQTYLTGAQNNYSTLTSAQLAEITIYTPNTRDSITCNGNPCPSTPPQEFITVTTSNGPNGPPTPTPEPGTTLLLGLGVTGLFLLSRRNQNHLPSTI